MKLNLHDFSYFTLDPAPAPAPEKKEFHPKREFHHHNNGFDMNRRAPQSLSFEDRLSRFLKESDERLMDLKRNTESKRGGRGARHAD